MTVNSFHVSESEAVEMVRLATVEDMSVRQIARQLQRSPTTVSKFLRRHGIDVWRDQVDEAVQARKQRIDARRLAIADQLLDDVDVLRERTFDAYALVVNSPEGTEVIELAEPPAEAVRAFSQSIRGNLSAVDEITSNVADGGAGAGKSMLATMMAGLTEMMKRDPDAGLGEHDRDSDYDVRDHLED